LQVVGKEARMETTAGLESQDARQAVLHLLERAQRRLARAVEAAHAADHDRLIHELVALACLAHMSVNVVRPMSSPPAS
jgi:hypothetical protein